ncbi:MAG TPA: hypothetical protein DCP36_05905 [Sporomusaceae bacterium]|jgi:hypothetical protein|uniref:hypothetical protein n=1 Tax=Anaerospora sp. TaxID=1960278 RepID=UPI000EE5A3E9|nr:hypothetical protein [Anaerospora sp.]HAK73228.1 hypothetical protein [Sporomusaceae bacterium]
MEEILKQILGKLEALSDDIKEVKVQLSNVEGQLKENTSILRVLEHRSEVQAAETEGLKLTTATNEAIERLDAKFDVLNTRLFQQETALQLIKKAQ